MNYWKTIGIVGILVGIACLTLSGCGQFLTKNWGGTSTITLQPGERLEMITWKQGDSLWVQVRPPWYGGKAHNSRISRIFSSWYS